MIDEKQMESRISGVSDLLPSSVFGLPARYTCKKLRFKNKHSSYKKLLK